MNLHRRFKANEYGGMAVTLSLTLPVILGICAFAVDLVYYRLVDNQLQTAADAAALTGVRYVKAAPNEVVARAVNAAHDNVGSNFGTIANTADIVVGTFNPITRAFTVGGPATNAVQVTTARDAQHGNQPTRFFSRIFGGSDASIRATAIAVLIPPNDCVIALEGSEADAIRVSGNGTMSVPNCGMHSNSSSASSVYAAGSSSVEALHVKTVGGYSGSNFNPVPLTNQAPINDPLIHLSEPTVPSSCTVTDHNIAGTKSFPGGTRFCGTTTVQNGANLTLEPGIHYFTGGNLVLKKRADLLAEDVMLYFDADSSLVSASQGTIRISARLSGEYRGMAFFQSRSTPAPREFRFSGGKEFFVGGTIYLSEANIEFVGTTDLTATQQFGYLIANKISYTGNTTLEFGSFGVPTRGLQPRAALVY